MFKLSFITLPTGSLILFVFVSNVSLFLPNILLFLGLNFPQEHLIAFLNASAYERYETLLSPSELSAGIGLMASIPMLSAIPGAFFGQYGADRWGRRQTVFYGVTITQIIASSIILAAYYAHDVIVYYVARAIFGFGFGILLSVVNLYISECSPPTQRGFIGNLTTVVLNCITTVVYLITLPEVLGGAETWHLAYAAVMPISFFAFSMSFILPESPKYEYLQRNHPQVAAKTIRHFYGPDVDPQKVLEHFEQERAQASSQVTFKEIWRTPHLKKGLIIAVLVASTRVTSGVLLLSIFSQSIYREQLNLEKHNANYIIVGLSVMTTCAALFGAFQIEKHGRRPLFLGCSFLMLGLTVAFIICSWLAENHVPSMKYPGLICIMAVFVVFSIAPNTLTFFFVTEIIPQTARAKVSTVSFVLSLILRIVYFTSFPVLQRAMGAFSLAVLVVLPLTPTLIYLFFEMPETKNRAVHEVVDAIIHRERRKSQQAMGQYQNEVQKLKSDGLPMIEMKRKSAKNTKPKCCEPLVIDDVEPEVSPVV